MFVFWHENGRQVILRPQNGWQVTLTSQNVSYLTWTWPTSHLDITKCLLSNFNIGQMLYWHHKLTLTWPTSHPDMTNIPARWSWHHKLCVIWCWDWQLLAIKSYRKCLLNQMLTWLTFPAILTPGNVRNLVTTWLWHKNR